MTKVINIGKITGDFIWHMENVLNLYEQPYDSRYPVVCFDERPCQLIGDTIAPIPMKPGSPKREDYEYSRNGTCCIFIAFEPLAGKRIIRVKRHRTKEDYAQFVKKLIQHYPMAEYTPRKGSWLNMAAIEISALSKQCLDRRIGDIGRLANEVDTWDQERNHLKAKVRWQFDKTKAREKLLEHYASVLN